MFQNSNLSRLSAVFWTGAEAFSYLELRKMNIRIQESKEYIFLTQAN